jgi:hypothetical protein
MLWVLSTLRAIHGSVQRGTYRAILPFVLALACMFSGAACRGDQEDTPLADDGSGDDSDASPIAGAIRGSFAVSSTGEATLIGLNHLVDDDPSLPCG